MLGFRQSKATAAATLAALGKSQATIEFDMAGRILTANQRFLDALGYTLDEIKGKHHGMFVEPDYATSNEYKQFWDDLRAGKYQAAQFKRIGKGGREVWIEASYNPILNRRGKPVKVLKIATDVTAQKLDFVNLSGQIDAINKVQAVIEFDLDGTIRHANGNFLEALGYALSEIKGKHHSMFVEPGHAASVEYRQFWEALRAGKYQAAQFKRIGRNGREVWIEASYNPIFDLNGKPLKVVKYATDITKHVSLLDNLKTIVDTNFGEIDGALDRSNAQAQIAVGAVRGTTAEVQSMAAGTEELAASVREIADTMMKSKAAVDTVFQQTATADEAMRTLASASTAMGGVVELIRDIAGQINLLALNATIESARAGDAGKGFAVVAHEVKSLARQAAGATDKIAANIQSLQTVSATVAATLGQIGASVGAVMEYVTITASAVEEQTAVTQELSSAMQRTARNVGAVNDNMSEISTAVHQVEQAVENTRGAAQVLVR